MSASAQLPADFRHVEAWIFDLDHTLYTLDAAQHRAMEERICVFVQRHFGLPRDPAWEIQKRYLREYGSTLAGLVRHDGVDPDIYHDAVNDLAALSLKGDANLRAALFDDSVRNLVPARARGMTTVWFNNGGGQSHWRVEDQGLHIDHETDDLARFLSGIRIATP